VRGSPDPAPESTAGLHPLAASISVSAFSACSAVISLFSMSRDALS
jgi:hypothetical protein